MARLTRRELLRRAALAASAAVAAPPWLARAVRASGHLLEIVAGDVTGTQAMVWTRTDAPARVVVEYGLLPSLGVVERSTAVQTGPEVDFTARIDLGHLRPNTRYFYRAVAERDDRRLTSLVGSFRTAPEPAEPADVTFVWGADTSERMQPFRIYDAMRGHAPDFFLFLGDTVYADTDHRARALEDYWAAHRGNRRDEPFLRFARATPVYAVWDDHEVANDFNPTHEQMPVGRQAFIDYWPIRPHPAEPGRLYRSFRWGRLLEVFVLDTRQYRSPQFDPDTAAKTLLGEAQKAWLKEGLRSSDAPFKVVATSVPLKYHGVDTWEGYTTERQEILEFIVQEEIRRVVFLAADVHYAAVLRYPQGYVEAISGPLAHPLIGRRRVAGEPETEFAYNSSFTYGLVRVTSAPLQLAIELRDADGRLLHRTVVEP